ncbi:MAG: hypothetical protein ABI678_05145 [Kofleriaceae bacterium]
MNRLVFVLLLAACSHGSNQPPPAEPAVPAADPAPCGDVADHTAMLLAKQADQLKAVIVKHCTEDKWSVELRRCGLLAKTAAELEPCHQEFVGTQFESLKKDVDALAAKPVQDVPPSTAPTTPPAANTMPK